MVYVILRIRGRGVGGVIFAGESVLGAKLSPEHVTSGEGFNAGDRSQYF